MSVRVGFPCSGRRGSVIGPGSRSGCLDGPCRAVLSRGAVARSGPGRPRISPVHRSDRYRISVQIRHSVVGKRLALGQPIREPRLDVLVDIRGMRNVRPEASAGRQDVFDDDRPADPRAVGDPDPTSRAMRAARSTAPFGGFRECGPVHSRCWRCPCSSCRPGSKRFNPHRCGLLVRGPDRLQVCRGLPVRAIAPVICFGAFSSGFEVLEVDRPQAASVAVLPLAEASVAPLVGVLSQLPTRSAFGAPAGLWSAYRAVIVFCAERD